MADILQTAYLKAFSCYIFIKILLKFDAKGCQ